MTHVACSTNPAQGTIDDVKLLEELKLRLVLVAGQAAKELREARPRAAKWVDVAADFTVSLDIVARDRPIAVSTLEVEYWNSKTKKAHYEAIAVGEGSTVEVSIVELVRAADEWLARRGIGRGAAPKSSVVQTFGGVAQVRVHGPPGTYVVKGSQGVWN